MILGELQDLSGDKAFDKSEHVGIGPLLDLAEESPFILVQEVQLIDFGDAIRKEFLQKIRLTSPDNILIDIPTEPF